jgi:integrase
MLSGVHPTWGSWVLRWESTSTLAPTTRRQVRGDLLRAGRWLADRHPEVQEPAQWDRELCAAYVAAVDRARIGDYVVWMAGVRGRLGQPLAARAKDSLLYSMRVFFRDCQEWGWIARRFDHRRGFGTPRSIKALIGPSPRVIADDTWAKLLWAGLNVDETDVPTGFSYPLPLIRALGLAWLFSGLRSNEIVRLRMGCVRWQQPLDAEGEAVCLLDIPSHKTGTPFTKPVDRLLGQALLDWEVARPVQPPLPDSKTGEPVALLFSHRAKRVGATYLNKSLIPALCRKAGVPQSDARGRITSHRARSTIASQLYNARDPMTLFELQAWLGHRSPHSTQHYAQITPTTLTKAYTDAGYFARNLRTIAVLVDREAVTSGAAASGEPWQFYDLGHGHCTYSFFEQCPHRMACARCDFYVPKASTKGQLLEAKDNLQRMLIEIPLTEVEWAAVEDGGEAVAHLLDRLADVPTPAGRTPRELCTKSTVPQEPPKTHPPVKENLVSPVLEAQAEGSA